MNSLHQSNNSNLITANGFVLLLFYILTWSFAVAQPVMEMLGNAPTFLVAHDLREWPLIFSTIILCFIPPILIWVIVFLSGLLSTPLKEWSGRFFSILLLALFLLPFNKSFVTLTAVLIALVAAVILLFLIIRFNLFRTLSTWFSPLALFNLGYFLFFSSANQLLPQISNDNHQSGIALDSQSPVFILVLDELPLISLLNNNGELNSSRFPAFSEFVNQATWYPNAKAISSATNLALPAILTGVNPENFNGRIGTYQQFEQNLFTLLSKTHEVNAFESMSNMCPPFLCEKENTSSVQMLLEDTAVIYLHRTLPDELTSKLPSINDRWIGFLHEFNKDEKSTTFSKRQEKFNTFITSFEKYPENTIHFLHVLLPHAPWNMLPDLKLYGFYESEGTPGQLSKNDPLASVAHQWTDDAWATELSWRRHLLQVGASDKLLKQALDKIKSLELFEQSMIVVVADHGSSFIPNLSRRYAHSDTISAISAIPMMIKYPSQTTAKVDLKQASNLDVLPTVLDALGVDLNQLNLDGQSLIGKSFRTSPLDMIQEGLVKTPMTETYQLLFDQQLRQQNRLFPGTGWKGLFKTEKSQPFYGMPVSQLQIRNSKVDAIRLSNSNLYEKSYALSSKYIPAYYRLEQLYEETNQELLVSINDQVVSHCITFVHSPNNCAGLIDPELLLTTTNERSLNIRFFAVIDHDGDVYVVDEVLQKRQGDVTLSESDGTTYVTFNSDQTTIVDKQGTLFGTATLRLINNQSTYQIDGWAGNTVSGNPADEVMLFVDNKLLTSVTTGVKKAYLFEKFGMQQLTSAGYQINIPVAQITNIENRQLRLFAKNKSGLISELNYTPNSEFTHLLSAFNTNSNRSFTENPKAILDLLLKQVSHQEFNGSLDALSAESSQFMAGDWYTIHDHTRWIGSHVYLALPISKNHSRLTIELSGKPFIRKGLLESQSIQVFINNNKIEEFNLTERDINNLQVHFELPTDAHSNTITIMLKMPNATAPSELGEGLDVRKLSVALSKFNVTLR